ncbi:MAG TPA: YlxR family protein [Chloroflexi bacterium]|nr:YlxR family protein [Chloroflexota bacterium]
MSPKKKHRPQRTCIACREVKDKQALLRIVRTSEQRIVVDETGKAQGRGAYLCKQVACWQKALDRGIIGRALKAPLTDQDAEALRQYASEIL